MSMFHVVELCALGHIAKYKPSGKAATYMSVALRRKSREKSILCFTGNLAGNS